MEAQQAKEIILNGKYSQAIRRKLKARTARSFATRHKGQPVAQEVVQTVSLPHPIYIQRAEGGTLTDVDGNTYIDTTMGFGPIVLGHNHPVVKEAVQQQIDNGWLFGLPCAQQFRLGELLREASPCTDEMIWANTGTEATMYAMRAARAYTGKPMIGVFDGAYHGAHDYALLFADYAQGTNSKPTGMYASAGISEVIKEETLKLLPYRNAAAFDLIRENKDVLAGIILEGSQNSNPRLDNGDFLQGLRDVCDECGVLLIFDEVVTGFRIDFAGIQGYYDITADLATYGKALGAGMAVGAVGGKQEIMQVFSGRGAEKRIFHGGTFNANPLAMAAGTAAVEYMREHQDTLYPSLMDKGNRLASEVNGFCSKNGIPAQVLNAGSKFHIRFQGGEINSSFDIAGQENKWAEREFYLHLLGHGVIVPGVHLAFLCDAHTDDDVAHIIASMQQSFLDIRADGLI